jgi:hypothetical protein
MRLSALVFYEGEPQLGMFAEGNEFLAEYYSYNVWRNDPHRFDGEWWDLIIFKDPPPEDLLRWLKIFLGIRFKGFIHLYDGKGGSK